MENACEFQPCNEDSTFVRFERPRLNNVFMKAVKHPLVVVCAGAGYGKTSAVHDFVQNYQADTAWIQLSERDNVGARFWENFMHSLMQINVPLAETIIKLGFPDTKDKLNRYVGLLHSNVELKRQIIVLDDFHCLEEPSVIRFVEECIVLNMPPETSVFIISRSTPPINIAGFASRNWLFNIYEDDLRFTESELAQYFQQLNISLPANSLYEIMQDTGGWAFAINLIGRSYKKAPGYEGYLRNAMKLNIFRLMETEIWDGISECLQRFLIRLSLIDHLSVDLIALLAGENKNIITEIEKQSAYIRHDSYINAYLIHPLFLEFLAQKQGILTDEEKHATYRIAGAWCNENGFKVDALSYYEKIGDYASIVSIFNALPAQIPHDIAQYAAEIFDRAPAQVFETERLLAGMHLRSYICQGYWQKSIELAKYYEAKFLKLPKGDPFRQRTLAGIYYCWGFLRSLMCLTDDNYDFDVYFEKFTKYVPQPVERARLITPSLGPWICIVGSVRKGAPEEFIDALTRTHVYMSRCSNATIAGEGELARGELKFYQGEVRVAEPLITHALDRARENNHHENVYRALFYLLRIAITQGDYEKAEQAITAMKAQLNTTDYLNRFVNFDIAFSWYHYILGLPGKIAGWLTEYFSPYGHAAFIENSGNQMKARFCYLTRNYPPLLSYIQEMKQRESFLFGRVEMLTIEACVHYKMKNKEQALSTLQEAYETALPNGLLMPFIELGKDMRTLTNFVLKESGSGIPKAWLESVNRKAASYAKHQTHLSVQYRKAKGITDNIVLSPRETEILTDLSHGLSRVEIAASRSLSINTVKMVINSIYAKAGAENLADLIRIAVERKMI